MEEKDLIDKMGICDVVPRSDVAEKEYRVIRARWVTVNKEADDAPQLRARWVAQEFRGRCCDKHENFSCWQLAPGGAVNTRSIHHTTSLDPECPGQT